MPAMSASNKTSASAPGRAVRPRLWLWLGLLIVMCAVCIIAFAAQLVFAASLTWSHAFRVSLTHWAMPFVVFVCGCAITWLGRSLGRKSALLHALAVIVLVTGATQLEEHLLRSGMIKPAVKSVMGPPEPIPTEPQNRFSGPPPPRQFGKGGPPAPDGRPMRMPPPRPFFPSFLASSRWQLNLAIYVISVCLTQAWLLYRRYQERERRAAELAANLTAAKLDALRLQLQPHFLFNSLNAIATLVHRSPQAAEDMIVNLSALLRESLEITAHEHTLRSELRILDHYLNMEQERFGPRLRVTQNIASDALDALVPSLLLQPLVENAVRHGIEPRTGTGEIAITARRDGDRLSITIRNDGPPPSAENQKTGSRMRAGGRRIGLANTEARLREAYGDDARFSFTCLPDGGALVEINLPVKMSSGANRGRDSGLHDTLP